jgi:hypothetical protein
MRLVNDDVLRRAIRLRDNISIPKPEVLGHQQSLCGETNLSKVPCKYSWCIKQNVMNKKTGTCDGICSQSASWISAILLRYFVYLTRIIITGSLFSQNVQYERSKASLQVYTNIPRAISYGSTYRLRGLGSTR